jgi:hypothetical protein
MDPLLTGWLSDLRASSISLGTAAGSGGAENLWTVALPDDRTDIGEDQLLEFVREAQRVRLLQATRAGPAPVVFYVWHDEMAGQLCFSVARGTAGDIPFSARVELVSELRQIVRSYLGSEFRRGIPWAQLETVPFDDDLGSGEHVVHVWAVGVT